MVSRSSIRADRVVAQRNDRVDQTARTAHPKTPAECVVRAFTSQADVLFLQKWESNYSEHRFASAHQRQRHGTQGKAAYEVRRPVYRVEYPDQVVHVVHRAGSAFLLAEKAYGRGVLVQVRAYCALHRQVDLRHHVSVSLFG